MPHQKKIESLRKKNVVSLFLPPTKDCLHFFEGNNLIDNKYSIYIQSFLNKLIIIIYCDHSNNLQMYRITELKTYLLTKKQYNHR